MSHLLQDLRFSLRALRKSPGFTAAVVLILGLGIGANVAIFSVVKAVLLEPLPYEEPARLVQVWEADHRTSRAPVAGPNFLDWRDQSRSFDTLVAYSPLSVSISGGADPERVPAIRVSPGVFEMLGIPPVLGRTFRPEEEEVGNEYVALISTALWQRRYGEDPDVLGSTIILDGEPFTIVGIMPRGFVVPSPWSGGEITDVWRPMPFEDMADGYEGGGRDSHSYLVLGRLAARVRIEEALEEVNLIHARLREQYPEMNEESGVNLVVLHEQLVGGIGNQLLMLLAASGFVLLIVCANIASLLMAKATGRQTELTVRISLGAGRGRLIGQLLTETLPLAVLGAAAGVLMAMWGVRILATLVPSTLPLAAGIGIDWQVLAFALGLSLFTGAVFGAAPALVVSQANLVDMLKELRTTAGTGRGRTRLRGLMVVAQLALALMLANGASLMIQSYTQVRDAEQGLDPEGVLTAGLSLRGPKYDSVEKIHAFYEELLARIEALPGVQHAAAISKLPLDGGTNDTVLIEGQEEAFEAGNGELVEVSVITPSYFRAMGIALLAGRNVDERDTRSFPPGVVVNRTMAERCWPDENPIGKRFSFDGGENWIPVVGVVESVRQWGLEWNPISEMYLTYHPAVPSFYSFTRVRWLVLRSEVDPISLAAAVRREVLAVDPDLPVSDIRTMGQIFDAGISRRRFNTLLTGIFATMALVLVAAGIYGVMAYFVAQRTHEIGVRMALGAQRGSVLRMVLGRGLGLALIGVALGLAGVFASTRVIRSMLYGVSPTDLSTAVGGSVFLMVVAVLACAIPALRATRVSPLAALRSEQ